MIVWLASYPRSGNTFLRVVLNSYFGQDTHSLHNDVHDIAANENMSRITGHQNLPNDFDIDKARHSDQLMFIKTHAPPTNPNDRVIYLLRDGRESCWSYAHYRLDYHGAEDLEKSLEEVIRGEVVFGSWAEHIESWSPQIRKNLLLIRFEDLVTSTEETVKRLENYLEIDAADTSAPTFKALHALNSKFFRSGSVDSWRNGFPAHLMDLFWLNSQRQMERFEYLESAPKADSHRPELFAMLQNFSTQHINNIASTADDQASKERVKLTKTAQSNALLKLNEDFNLAQAASTDAWRANQHTNRAAREELRKELHNAQNDQEKAEAQALELKQQLGNLIEAQTQSKAENKKLKQRVNSLTETLSKSKAENQSLNQNLIGLTQAHTESATNAQNLLQEIESISTEVTNLSTERKALVDRNQSLLDDFELLREDLQVSSESLANLLKEREEILDLFAQLVGSRALRSPRLKYQRYSALMQKLRDQFDAT